MNNETEQIFIVNTSNTQPLVIVPKVDEASVSTADIEDFSTVCRTCATVTEFVIPIFEGEGLQNNLADKIHKHLPIQVSEQDVLPRVVCYQCASTLLAWHELVQCCLQADEALRARVPGVATQPYDTAKSKTINKDTSQSSAQEQPQKSQNELNDMMKGILIAYFPTLFNASEELDMECVCNKCPATMSSVIELSEHFTYTHPFATTDCQTLESFIKEHITFKETLFSHDSESDADDKSVSLNFNHTEKSIENIQNFFCPFCENIFSSTTRLICHLNQHFGMSLEKGVICCEKTYYDKKTFVQHLQNHHASRVLEGNVNICRNCGFEAEDSLELQTHVTDVHENKKPYKNTKEPSQKNQKYIPAVCSECNRTFSNKYNMFVHMKSHSGKEAKRFPCDKCEKSYSSLGNLKSHKSVAHEGMLKFPCNFCGEAFPSRSECENHERKHSGDKPYSCQRCNKSFRAKNTLDRHLDMHLDIRKYQCHVCPSRFRKKSHLDYHLGTHKSEK